MVDLKVTLSGWTLDNPIIAASGTFCYGKEFAKLYDINVLGSFSFKGTTLNPRFGNPTPRVADCRCGMINSVGLQNPGAKSVTENELPQIKEYFSKKVIANVGGFSIEEYVETSAMMDEADNVGMIELNISCPNVHNGGMAFGTNPVNAYNVVKAVRQRVKKPLYVKLSPNVTDITEIAAACCEAGADGLSMINTVSGMRIDLKRRRPVLANVTGGYSGDGIFPIALAAVYRTYEKVNVPIVGMGGISRAEDVIEMMLAGATAVQIGAANLVDPFCCKRIIEELPKVMQKYGIQKITDIIGGAHNG